MESWPLPAMRDSTHDGGWSTYVEQYSSCPWFRFCASSVGGHISHNLQSFGAFALHFVRLSYIQYKINALSTFLAFFEKKRDLHTEQLVFTFHRSWVYSSELCWAIQDAFAASITTSVSFTVPFFPARLPCTANEGPVWIQHKWLVSIYVFPEMQLCGLVISKTEL